MSFSRGRPHPVTFPDAAGSGILPRLAEVADQDGPPFNQKAVDCGVADGSGRGKHIPRVPLSLLARRSCAFEVDFTARKAAYYGCNGEEFVEPYPSVEVDS